ncbi:pentatricopeptide repeat-containing protein At3g63370, chloroplastic isoform X1 [Coffea arabica]|uniref:Pentatricopeptide repeat-containing protein At3g63370, chloroplastic isoform X1 n=1 Tax=Coffea arabica TaxID=13443 RepID=A0A6P6UYW1_COFAR
MATLSLRLSPHLPFPPTSTINSTSSKTNGIPPFVKYPVKTFSLREICQEGKLREAFRSFGNDLTSPDHSYKPPDEAYSLILELCAAQKALSQGQQIHAHVLKSKSVADAVFLDTKLVFMYGKCGSLLDARKVFDEMLELNIFAWNAMIGACVGNDRPLGALELYKEMRMLDFPLDAHTFPSLFKACAAAKDLCSGCEIHGLTIKLGFLSNAFVVNSLVGMYSKCDDIPAAYQLFSRTSVREDVVAWNSLISAHAASGMSTEGLGLFEEMLYAGVTPSSYTFVPVLQACEEPALGKLGRGIHAIVLKSGRHLETHVANSLVVMYAKNNSMDEAARVFSEMKEKDNISWNSMLSGFVQNGLYEDALCVFSEMKNLVQKPDQISLVSMLAASGRLGNLSHGMQIHAFSLKNKMDNDLLVGNTLVDMYAKCGRTDYMHFVFDRMPYKDSVTWTTAISGYARNNLPMKSLQLFREINVEKMEVDMLMIGSILLACSDLKCHSLVKEIHAYFMRRGLYDLVTENTLVKVYGDCKNINYACKVFKLIEFKNVVSFTSMMSSYVDNGLASEALELVPRMKENKIELDCVATLSILSAAADLSALRKGKEIHGFLLRNGFIIEGPVASSLVDMYACCGIVDDSYKVFSSTLNKDLPIWTSMISAYGMHGYGKVAIDLFRRLESENLVPDHITFLAVLYACSHSALVEEGKEVFESMQDEYKLKPWPEHYTCMVDMLARANYLEEAFHFVTMMKAEPTAAVWCALLGACRVHSNEKIREIAASKLMELDPVNPGNYVLVSNAYAATERWEDVEEVRSKMKGKELKKDPACSWIEVGNKFHVFIAHDRSHPESDEIKQNLDQITEKLVKGGGYVPQTKYVLHNVEEEEKIKLLTGHSERLAISYGLLNTTSRTPIRITKNLRVCGDCHNFTKLTSKYLKREIIVRDASRFHHFRDGVCSCGDFW